MNLEVDVERLSLAHKAVRAELLAERAADGHWVGHIGSSPFATAAAVSALVVAHHRDSQHALRESGAGDGQVIEQVVQGDLSELLLESVHWLARQQNPDGGWGDCEGGTIQHRGHDDGPGRVPPDRHSGQIRRSDGSCRRLRRSRRRRRGTAATLQRRQNIARRDHGQLCAGRHGHLATSADAATRIGLLANALAAQHSGARRRATHGPLFSRSAAPSFITIRPRIRSHVCWRRQHLAKEPVAPGTVFRRPTTASWHPCRSRPLS